jgi:hypothetical protein
MAIVWSQNPLVLLERAVCCCIVVIFNDVL